MKYPNFRMMTMAVAGAAAMALAPMASATVTGTLFTGVASNENVTVTSTTISWHPTTPSPNFNVNNTTTLQADGATITATQGTLKDLDANTTVFPLDKFLSFVGANTDVDFTLLGIGPGNANTDCSTATLAPTNGTCSAFAGSPFLLTYNGGNTSVSLHVFGTVTDTSGIVTNWDGAFTQTLTVAPEVIQRDFVGGCTASDATALAPYGGCSGAITDTHSGTFTATAVPEPSTAFLGLSGLLMAAGLIRRRRRS
jgi:hypothetical protein